ncbi:hypothetical protein CYMTET_38799 [Cymbomonas tetramitiformis]|uniref:Uncharacterized protein n=1 Tax=Cymbomonas tetramitiformis TaxID=36881 RepID=A0AAE0CDJ1_9CHLO|nr:hypothetical protein CYMTET_38799 [Cymbomonas tetramitiformis]
MFFRGASTIPGIVATMESDERGHREDRRLADRHATHLVVLEKSVPVLLRNRAFKNKDTFAHSLPSYPIVFLQLACELISVEFEDDPCNFYLYPSRIHGFDFISMNLNATGKVATELRVSKFRLLIRAENSRNFFHSLLDLVRKYSDDIVELTFNVDDPTDPVDGNACSMCGRCPRSPTCTTCGRCPSSPTRTTCGRCAGSPTRTMCGRCPGSTARTMCGCSPGSPTRTMCGRSPGVPTRTMCGRCPGSLTRTMCGRSPGCPAHAQCGRSPGSPVMRTQCDRSPGSLSCAQCDRCPGCPAHAQCGRSPGSPMRTQCDRSPGSPACTQCDRCPGCPAHAQCGRSPGSPMLTQCDRCPGSPLRTQRDRSSDMQCDCGCPGSPNTRTMCDSTGAGGELRRAGGARTMCGSTSAGGQLLRAGRARTMCGSTSAGGQLLRAGRQYRRRRAVAANWQGAHIVRARSMRARQWHYLREGLPMGRTMVTGWQFQNRLHIIVRCPYQTLLRAQRQQTPSMLASLNDAAAIRQQRDLAKGKRYFAMSQRLRQQHSACLLSCNVTTDAGARAVPQAVQHAPSSAMADDPASHSASASVASQAVQHVPLSAMADGSAAHSASVRSAPQAVPYVSPSAMADNSSAAHGANARGVASGCKWFWYCKCCPHILAGYHLRDGFDIFGMMERAFLPNKPKTMRQKRAAEASK